MSIKPKAILRVIIVSLLLFIVSATTITLCIYDIKFNYDDYDILLKNRLTKLGFGIMYKEKFEIWHFAHTVHGGIAEKPLYPSISVDEILEEAGMWETGQFKNQQVKEQ